MRKSVLFAFLFIIISGLVLVSPVHFSLAQDSTLFKISGYILDSDGHGIEGAQIIFNMPSVVPSVDSDSSGYYLISAPAGTYHITVWPPFDSNYIYYDQPVFVVGSDITKNITLASGYKVSGYITDSSGNPVSKAVVSLDNFFCGWYSNYSGYYFVTAPAGTYTLSVTPRLGYDHFSSYFESNFALNGDTTKNITVSDHTPPPSTAPEEPFLDPSPSSTSMMWNRTYGGKPYETAESVIETSDGGFAIAGWRWYYEGMVLVKTDKFGNMEWVQTYGKNEVAHDGANSVIETSDGGYALAGYRRSGGRSGYNDFLLVKTDAYGKMEWNKTYGGTDGDGASTVVETSDGGYALAGLTISFGAGYRDFWLIKTDEYGNMEWNMTYGGTGSEQASALVETSDGGFALAGGTDSFGAGESDFWLIKTDSHGNMEWNMTYGGTGSEQASALVETSDGGFALAGGGLLVKTDVNGVMEWNQTYPLPFSPYIWATTSLVATSDGGYALSRGESLVKTDADGNMEWNQTFEGTEIRSIQSLVETSDGGYVLAGFYGSAYEPGQADFWLIKTDEHGIIPEFPSWIILPLFLIATIVVIIYRNRLKRKVS